MQRTKFWVILGHFLPFDPLNNPKFWKNKITPGDIIILHLCTTNVDHTVSGSWDIKNEIIFCYFGPFLCPLTLLTIQKIKILKKFKKNAWRYYNFTLVYCKCWSYDVWLLRYQAWQTEFFVILGYFLPFYHPNHPEKQNFEKMKKILEILSFYRWVPWIKIIWCMIPEIKSATERYHHNDNHMIYGLWDMHALTF